MSGLSNSRQTSSSTRPAAGERDRDAVAAGQVEAALLRARPDEEQHGDRDQQHRGLDEREDAERRHVGLDDLAALEVRLLVPGQEQRERERERRRARPSAAPSAGRRDRCGGSSDRDVLHLALARSAGCRGARSCSRAPRGSRSAARAARRRAGGRARAGAGRAAPRRARAARSGPGTRSTAAARRRCSSRWAASRPPRRAGLLGARLRLAHEPLGRLVGLAVGLSHPRTPRRSEPSSSVADVGLKPASAPGSTIVRLWPSTRTTSSSPIFLSETSPSLGERQVQPQRRACRR